MLFRRPCHRDELLHPRPLRRVHVAFAVELDFVGLVELTSFLTIGAAQGKTLVLFGNKIDVKNLMPWAISVASLLVGGAWLRVEARAFHRVWETLMLELAPRRVVA